MTIPIILAQTIQVPALHRQYQVPSLADPVSLDIKSGQVTIIIGPNGTGKSALSFAIYKGLGQGAAEFFPGHRQIHFSSSDYDYIGQPLAQLEANLYSQPHAHNRFRAAWSEDHLKSVIKRLMNDEFVHVSGIAAAALSNNPFSREKGPLAVLNAIFSGAGIPIAFRVDNGSLKASRENGATFAIDRLSDGERAALLLAGAVIVRPLNGVLIIDEPEKHLHEGISGPFIASAIRVRPDLAFVFTTHAMSLLEWLKPENILHVRNSVIIGEDDERLFDTHLMTSSDGISEDVKASIAGARKKLLFVEGTTSSSDIALYSQLYEEWHLVAKGGADTVIANTRAINMNNNYSWLTAKGLIDRDGRDASEVGSLASDQIHALSVPTVENLFCIRSVMWQMADLIHNFSGSGPAEECVSLFEQSLPALLQEERTNIIYREALWHINRALSATKLSVKNLKDGKRELDPVDVPSLILRAEQQVDAILQLSPFEALRRLPIKNTSLLGRVATHLSYASVNQYKAAIVRQIELGSKQGALIRAAIQADVPSI